MTEYFIGTSGWNYPEWKGNFYPAALRKDRWLEFYSSYFRSVEVNATFYRLFTEQTYSKWYNAVPENFRFILKAHRSITHLQMLKIPESLQEFWQNAQVLKNKLGLILLQLNPRMPYDLTDLRHTLQTLNHPEQFAVEFRNPQWFTDEVKTLLIELKCVFCDAESPKIVLINWLTSDTAYLRLHGRQRWYDYNYSKAELNEIAHLARSLSQKGAKTIYIMFDNTMSGNAPRNALEIMELLA